MVSPISHFNFPRTPLAGCLHLLDAGLVANGIPGLTPEQREHVVHCRVARDAFLGVFAAVKADHLDAAFGLYLSHIMGGFSPTNAKLCHEILHDVIGFLDADLQDHSLDMFSSQHRGASTLSYGRHRATLLCLTEPPLSFRLEVHHGDRLLHSVSLSSLDIDQPEGAERIAQEIANATGMALA